MKIIILALLFFLAVLLETTLIQLPFVLLLLLTITIFYRSEWIFIVSIFLGIVVDSLLFRHVGLTSFFYLLFVLGVFWYEQKFELRTIPFVALMSCMGSLLFFLIFGSQILLLQVIASGVVGVGLFVVFSFFEKPPSPKYHVQ